ncbi:MULTISPECIES: PTS sugar transporter subunit IIB [Clostridium]|uniref:PTS system, diacetylchitobiose-specific IIB component n=1 Tax=Clostridium botulinum (strain Eklund 17B / Type B) TaxID=935198 RepID=B2TLJ9_CLOBB|nr:MULTISPECIES: PTS sugar transporter subunit IIB [Clostridium]ACD24615.1 PTS system, diacetylchitobiose-specific IIB component [Clostridium botulinum B str. Eklund 17B (NRP)]MBN1052426.1 PTS sugar transporter subunit IIB [Clostridium botulinum]MBN1055540.1 PTS sugar transporter subunit IIB [Clostridium botulinum]MBY6976958.1 PTS sugar transporter subunit IIB [Clostridium botulinum]MBY6999114.1 PTS sugar transporter subunit IIB [Clostridium botulinum]
MKVLMVCSGGMSSAIVVEAIKKEAIKVNFALEINAVGTSDFYDELKNGGYDLALVAPQVRHRLDTFKEQAEEFNVPVEVIIPMGYTPLGGGKVLKQIKAYAK